VGEKKEKKGKKRKKTISNDETDDETESNISLLFDLENKFFGLLIV
jgi:hypothetical protein